MNRPARTVIAVASLTLLLALTILGTRDSRSRTALQKYQAQLRQRGEALTLEELAARRPPIADHSPSNFLDAVATLKTTSVQPGNFNVRNYVAPGQARVLWKQSSPAWQELCSEKLELEPALAELRAELKDPPPNWGTRTNVFSRMGPDFVSIRHAAQWLAMAALVNLPEGDATGAVENLEALAGLAQMNRYEYTLVAQMIRVAVARLGCGAIWESLQATGWTEPQLARVQKAWQAVDLIEAAENGFVGERIGGTELWRLMRQPGGGRKVTALMNGSAPARRTTKEALEQAYSEYVVIPVYKMTSIDDDQLFYLHTMQDSLDALRRVRLHQPWKQARQGQDRNLVLLGQLNSLAQFHYWLSMISIPNFSKANDTAVRTETDLRLALTALALKRFQLRRRTLPATLEELVPDLIPAVPLDPMSGRPLNYHRVDSDAFVLYSTGEDGEDNGGDAGGSASSGFELWSGRDAVWPTAAEAGASAQP